MPAPTTSNYVPVVFQVSSNSLQLFSTRHPIVSQCQRHNTCLEEMALRKCNILSNFVLPQNQSKGFKHAHAAHKHHLNHFWMFKSQNISHALCAHFCWLRTARWDEKSGWWRCPKLDAKTVPNSQQPKRKNIKMFQKKQTVSIANFSC